jgi:hypothetical protein
MTHNTTLGGTPVGNQCPSSVNSDTASPNSNIQPTVSQGRQNFHLFIEKFNFVLICFIGLIRESFTRINKYLSNLFSLCIGYRTKNHVPFFWNTNRVSLAENTNMNRIKFIVFFSSCKRHLFIIIF